MTNDDKYLNSDELREAIEKVGLPEGLNVYDATEGMRYWREEKDSLGRILQYPEMDNAPALLLKHFLDKLAEKGYDPELKYNFRWHAAIEVGEHRAVKLFSASTALQALTKAVLETHRQ